MEKVFDKKTMDAKFEHTYWEADEIIEEFENRLIEEYSNEKVKIIYFVCIPSIIQPHRIYVGIDAINIENNEELFSEELYQFDRNLMQYLDEFLTFLDFITKSKSLKEDNISFMILKTETNFNKLCAKIKFRLEKLNLEDVNFSYS